VDARQGGRGGREGDLDPRHVMEAHRVSSGSPFEPTIGFSRAIRAGDRILVSGTGPVGADEADVATQMRRCLEIVAAALGDLGATLDHVVRTRMYLTDARDWEAVGRVHGEAFATTRPAATMVVVAGLLDPRWSVEMEAEALLRS
jgi:enamine deaminase RidA (YjgF/YER057c/UK114 family)